MSVPEVQPSPEGGSSAPSASKKVKGIGPKWWRVDVLTPEKLDYYGFVIQAPTRWDAMKAGLKHGEVISIRLADKADMINHPWERLN